MRWVVPAGSAYSNTGSAPGTLKLFAKLPPEALEVRMAPEYDHGRAKAMTEAMPGRAAALDRSRVPGGQEGE
jgi:hypothetical protein